MKKTINSISFVVIAVLLITVEMASAQSVSINPTGNAPDAQSILDVSSTNKGVLFPRMTTGQRNSISPTASSDFGLIIYNTTSSTYDYWDGTSWQQIPNANGIVTSLDGAYDGGGAGLGRTITGDAGSVRITGTSGSVALETDGDIQMAEDQWVGLGSTLERIGFDGSLNRIDVEAADVTMDSDKWIGVDGSSPRIEFEDASGRLNMQDADIEIDPDRWIGINASNPRIEFDDTQDRLDMRNADIELDAGKWIGIGSTVERIEFDGANDEISLLGADIGIGTTSPDPQSILEVASSNKGVLFPRMTTAERDAIGQGTNNDYGLWIFNETTGLYNYWDGTVWQEIVTNSNNGHHTLDESYDEGGAGAGRTITADGGAVNIAGSDGLTVNGNVGIGTTTANNKLNIEMNSGAGLNYIIQARNTGAVNGNESGAGIGFGMDGTTSVKNALYFERTGDFSRGKFHVLMNNVNSSTPATIADAKLTVMSTGNVGVGVTNPTVKFQVAGDATISGKFNSNGIQESSDIRFKRNVTPLANALNNVMKLEGVSYNWKQDEFPDRNFGSQTEIGVIAQEVEKIYPELVATDSEGYKSVQYSHLVPVLIEAIKEQQKQISSLQNTTKMLNEQYSSLKEYLGSIEREQK